MHLWPQAGWTMLREEIIESMHCIKLVRMSFLLSAKDTIQINPARHPSLCTSDFLCRELAEETVKEIKSHKNVECSPMKCHLP